MINFTHLYLGIFSLFISVLSFLNILYCYYFKLYLNIDNFIFTFIVSLLLGSVAFFNKKNIKKISIYQKCGFPIVKSCFLKVGGPAWELKIDAERLQETEKNEGEEESEKRREKSAYIWPEKGPPKKCFS